LKKNGVKVISARENISEGSERIILEAMLEGYAEYYSAELSEKVIRGLTDNALKCKYNGCTVPMGYYIDEQQYYQIDPKTAPVVLEMFTRYSEGATMQELVNLLNSRGMRSIRGGKITLNIMNHLLKNRRYMGEYSYRDVVKEDGIPAIVPKDLFDRVQERLAKNKKSSRPSQSRGRLPFDNEAVLWEMRLLYGGRKRHKTYDESTPLLSLCEYQEKEAMRQESSQERLD
jgi:resolvase domain protein